jgi:hypothetical protein
MFSSTQPIKMTKEIVQYFNIGSGVPHPMMTFVLHEELKHEAHMIPLL